jgi:8-oxo-dGTP pyrophosphatase MutT (NUDIX family)
VRWKVHGRRTMYESDWVNVYLDDVELPDGTHIEHHVLTMPKASQTAIVLNESRDQVLLIWRHRFITDKWGWEVPAGWVEPGEMPEEAIRREVLEETGYEVDEATPLIEYDAIPGLSTMHFTTWLVVGGRKIRPAEGLEASRVEWHQLTDIATQLSAGNVSDGPSLTALSYFLASSDRHV